MYERDLQDLIRGLRSDAAKQNEARFISQVVEEIRKEIATSDMDLKGGAVCKLTYLEMLGYDMSWASFHVVEVMSSPHFHIKCGGYLAATQSFTQDTDVLMLTTNLLKKDMASGVPADVSAALNCLAHIVTPSLAQDLSLDLIPMLNHTRPLIRKRAVLILYKIILLDPDAFDLCFHRLRERLEDTHVGVISATVNVLCELARRDPERYLPLAPQLFGLLTTSSNNWMLIKIVKIFGCLTPLEPRLVKKLQTPITDLINTTAAISLLYECVRTCIIGNLFQGSSGHSLAKTCVNKLAVFLDDPDQNRKPIRSILRIPLAHDDAVKYIALLALVKIVPAYPHLVVEYQRFILSSISDTDLSIRMRAMDLLSAMVDRNNLQTIVQHLLSQLSPQQDSTQPTASETLARVASGNPAPAPSILSHAYRVDVCRRIIEMCSREMYSNISDFEWYLSVLVDLAYVAGVDVDEGITSQILDVVVRVRAVRAFSVRLMTKIMGDPQITERVRQRNEGGTGILWVAAHVDDPAALIQCLLQQVTLQLPPDVRAAYVLSSTKILGSWATAMATAWDQQDRDAVAETVTKVKELAAALVSDPDIEVQERTVTFVTLLEFMRADILNVKQATTVPVSADSAEPQYPKSLRLIAPMFSAYELNAVATEAQESIRLPLGLDLDFVIVPDNIAYGDQARDVTRKKKKKKASGGGPENIRIGTADCSSSDVQNPYYLGDESTKATALYAVDIDSIPIVSLGSLPLPQERSSTPKASAVVDRIGEMPDEAGGPSSAIVDPSDGGDGSTRGSQAVRVVRSKKKSSKGRRGGVS
ncbi:AP-3 complex subunit delta [Tulasnella sp. 331]|nr:AP-3 complex subunit delta [Tulasnella sp. 331]